MNKMKFLVSAGLACLLSVRGLEARLRFVGPNPYYSFLTFPQDSRLFTPGSSFSFFYLRHRGWMGHLDVPELSPSPTYVNTQESVAVGLESGQTAQAGFKGSWFEPEVQMAPYVFEFKSVRVIPLFSGKFASFSLNSSGMAVTAEKPAAAFPFSSSLSQKNGEASVGLMASTIIKRIPIGIMFNYRRYEEGAPRGGLRYTLDGQETRLNRFNWGWSTVSSCNHIFGVKANIDAFWEDRYVDTMGSQFDVVVGADVNENKLAFRVRRLIEYGDSYSYKSAADSYIRSPSRSKSGKTMLRASDLFKITNIEGAKLFLCTVVEGDFLKQRYLVNGEELLDSYRENAFAAEFLPIIHFDLDRGGFLRIGTSASFFWKGYGHRQVWGKQEVYAPGWAHIGWEMAWERSSYGRSFSFINFTEADLELPIIDRWNVLLSLDVWSHQVFAWTNRYYGNNVSGDGTYNFSKEAERNNYLRESWFGGTFGLMAGKRLSVGVFLDLPVYYDKYTTTAISGVAGSFEGKANAQPAIRKPVCLWALIIMRW
ncbi:MAG: hypothetical protein FJY81_00120 [Candidatus Aminicenantes bacterium]|nr:hypothetical protein [Candidatus Aminicenantes bacterium]